MRIFLITLTLVYVAGVSFAQSVFTQSDDCPVEAEVTAYFSNEGVEAADLNSWRGVAAEVTPVVDLDIAETPQANRIFARFRADPKTGEVLTPPASLCGGLPRR